MRFTRCSHDTSNDSLSVVGACWRGCRDHDLLGLRKSDYDIGGTKMVSATLEMVEIRARELQEKDPDNIEIAYMLSDICLVRKQLKSLRDRARAGTIRLNNCATRCSKCGRIGSGEVTGQICNACGFCKGMFVPNWR